MGFIPALNASDPKTFAQLVRATRDVEHLNGFAIGPATMAGIGPRPAVETISGITPGMSVIYFHTSFEPVWTEHTSSPVIEASMIETLSLAGVAAMVGYLKQGSAEETIAEARKADIEIIFGGRTTEGYKLALDEGVTNFFLGNDPQFVGMMAAIIPRQHTVWVTHKSIDMRVTVPLMFALKERNAINVIVPSELLEGDAVPVFH
jgi:hypothetical protein